MLAMSGPDPKGGDHSATIDKAGWALLFEGKDFIEIKFVFVKPEDRRQGWFTALLCSLKMRRKRITVCSRKSDMIRALVARGFTLNGRSADGKELFYILEPHV